jgi:hypothetical protein
MRNLPEMVSSGVLPRPMLILQKAQGLERPSYMRSSPKNEINILILS